MVLEGSTIVPPDVGMEQVGVIPRVHEGQVLGLCITLAKGCCLLHHFLNLRINYVSWVYLLYIFLYFRSLLVFQDCLLVKFLCPNTNKICYLSSQNTASLTRSLSSEVQTTRVEGVVWSNIKGGQMQKRQWKV